MPVDMLTNSNLREVKKRGISENVSIDYRMKFANLLFQKNSLFSFLIKVVWSFACYDVVSQKSTTMQFLLINLIDV